MGETEGERGGWESQGEREGGGIARGRERGVGETEGERGGWESQGEREGGGRDRGRERGDCDVMCSNYAEWEDLLKELLT